jgi:competence protein ComEC
MGWTALIGEYFIVTLVAQASVLPLIAFHFHQVSPLFLLANPLVLPIQPLVMVLGLLAMSAGMFSLAIGKTLAWLTWPFAAYTNAIVRFLAELWPDAVRMPRFEFSWVLLVYALSFFLLLNNQKQAHPWLNSKFWLVVTGVSALILWVHAANLPDNHLKLRILPAQDKANLLITTPAGRYVFIGGSCSANGLSASLSQAMPVTHQEVDWLIIPRCSRSDVSALFSLPDQVRVRQVLWLCDWERIQTTQSLFARFSQLGLNQRKALPEDALLLAPELLLRFTINGGVLESARLDGANFTMSFAKQTSPSGTGILLTPDHLILSNSVCTGLCPYVGANVVPFNLSDYAWLEIQTDKNSVFLNGKH